MKKVSQKDGERDNSRRIARGIARLLIVTTDEILGHLNQTVTLTETEQIPEKTGLLSVKS